VQSSLSSLLSHLRSITFFQRIFAWGSVKQQLIDAAADWQKLSSDVDVLRQQNATLSAGTLRAQELEKELAKLNERLDNTRTELQVTKHQNATLLAAEDERQRTYAQDVATLNTIRTEIQNERSKEVTAAHDAALQKLQELKNTWSQHEAYVKQMLKNICNKHVIEYVEKAPFKGEPDNTLLICDEYVVFDAKSPAGDDLNNFPGYLKEQTEKARKYAKQEGVKADVYLVVPGNTLQAISRFSYNLGDYNVYIIAADALEPVILTLKKIEEYEFVQQLSPEERENICRVLGNFAHLSKRRIQIDSFFARQFIELAYKCETTLPADVLEKVMEFERAEKLNPPIEKRSKAISTKELEADAKTLSVEAAAKGIAINDPEIASHINHLPLYIAEENS
jgi:hypothetical protein